MKIDTLSLLPSSAAPAATPVRPQEDFAQILRAALGSGSSPQACGAANVRGLGEIALEPVAEKRLPAALESVLTRLEHFARDLGNRQVHLKDLATLAHDLERDSHRLAVLSRSLGPDSPLRSLLEEAAALAYVEAVKFQRGDYL